MAVGIFVGLATIDLIHTVDEFPPPNAKVVAQGQELIVGGPATNAAIAFRHFGMPTALVAAVGHNRLGTIISNELEHYRIDLVDLASDFAGAPAISSVWVDRAGRRSVVSVNASLLPGLSREVDLEVISDARVLLVDGHSMQACHAWARAAHAKGIPVVFDGGSWKEGTEDLLGFVGTAICSADFQPPGCANQDEVLQYLQLSGVKQMAVTHGADPIDYVSGSEKGTIVVPQVEAVDSTGAGDILHGAFCHFVVRGQNFAEALRSAATVASQSCRYPGTRRWMQARAT